MLRHRVPAQVFGAAVDHPNRHPRRAEPERRQSGLPIRRNPAGNENRALTAARRKVHSSDTIPFPVRIVQPGGNI